MAMTHNDSEAASTNAGCSCLRRLCCGWDAEETGSYILHDDSVAPQRASQWKNLVRKIGGVCNPRKFGKSSSPQFRYSPESYALNFSDDGAEEDDSLLHSFSIRYAPGFSVADQQKKAAC